MKGKCSPVKLNSHTISHGRGLAAAGQWPVFVNIAAKEGSSDHFVRIGNEQYAGIHILADFWEVHGIDDLEYMESTLRRAVDAAGATLLHIHLHHFTPGKGISGVAVLAESHIGVHTWPERGLAAFDIFMCGDCRPEEALHTMEKAFSPGRTDIRIYRRGRVGPHSRSAPGCPLPGP